MARAAASSGTGLPLMIWAGAGGPGVMPSGLGVGICTIAPVGRTKIFGFRSASAGSITLMSAKMRLTVRRAIMSPSTAPRDGQWLPTM